MLAATRPLTRVLRISVGNRTLPSCTAQARRWVTTITTPIFYVNGSPHIGHAHSAVVADATTRWQRLLGRDTFLVTGTDEHGLKVQETAAKHGVSPQEWCDRISQTFRDSFDALDISYDRFIRTTDEEHKKNVQALWRLIDDRGYIYKGTHQGWYSTVDECFVPDGEVCARGEGHVVEASGHAVAWVEESNYKFRLSSLREPLIRWLDSAPPPIWPPSRLNEARALLHDGELLDVSISRPAARVSWGIEVPVPATCNQEYNSKV